MWYFRILQLALIVLLIIYYSTLLIEVFSNGKFGLNDYDPNDKKIWVPFYTWFKKTKNKKKK